MTVKESVHRWWPLIVWAGLPLVLSGVLVAVSPEGGTSGEVSLGIYGLILLTLGGLAGFAGCLKILFATRHPRFLLVGTASMFLAASMRGVGLLAEVYVDDPAVGLVAFFLRHAGSVVIFAFGVAVLFGSTERGKGIFAMPMGSRKDPRR